MTIHENASDLLRQYRDVLRGHDHVHPDRNACGGIGRCALLRAESDLTDELLELIRTASRVSTVTVYYDTRRP